MNNRPLVTLLVALLVLLPVRGQELRAQQTPSAPPAKSTTPPASPQTPTRDDQDDVVRITTSLVQLDAVVTRDGKQVTDLTAEDFEIFEDGRPQTITNFSYISTIPATAASPSNIAATPPVKNKNGPPVLPAIVRPQDTGRTIAIVVDDLGVSFESMGPIRKQLRRLVDEQVLPSDLVAIIRTGGEVGALQQFTTDKRLLYRTIDSLRRNPCSRVGLSASLPVGGMSNGVGICGKRDESLQLTTRALRFILQGMRELPGRKSLVILSDDFPVEILGPDALPGQISTPGARIGEDAVIGDAVGARDRSDFGNEAALKRVAELAIRASVVIYGVDTRGMQITGLTAADNFSANGVAVGTRGIGSMTSRTQTTLNNRSRDLQDGRGGPDMLARETGGFLVHNSNDFGLQRVMRDQEGYYLIAYRPTGATFNRRFHHITARAKRSGLTVRTRAGFFGMTDEESRPVQPTNRDKMNIALMSPFGAVDIAVHLTSLFANTPATGSLLRSLLYFQAQDLTFTDEPDGWHQATFNLSGIIFGNNGKVVQQVTDTRTLRLQGEEYDRLRRGGIVYHLDIPVNGPGAYQFRVAVRDTTSARIGTAGQFVEVPDLKSARLALSGITLSSGGAANDPAKTGAGPATSPAQSSDDQMTAADSNPLVRSALRRFRQGSNLFFGYAVYNAQLDTAAHRPNLTAQAKLFRDGKLVYEGQLKLIDLAGQTDLERITAGGGLRLGSTLSPGEYILQVFVSDALANEKNRTANQWIDFEIVQ